MTLLDPQPRRLEDPALWTDAELIAAVRAGDRAAYAQLYERHEPAARRMARQLSASPHDVDDLVAEAFARVFDMLSSGRGPDTAFRAYLLTAVRNGRYERARRDRRLELSEDMARHDQGEPWVDPVEAELDSSLAARAFASLPERWQTVLWYSEVEQETTAEVGSRLGLRPNAVAALAYRAREGLRQAFLQAHVTGRDDGACRETVARLAGWTRDRLSSADAARVDAHLASCRPCRQLAAELEEVNSGLRGLLAPLLVGGAAASGSLASLVRDPAGAAASAGAGSAGAVSAAAGSTGAGSAGAASAGVVSAAAGSAGAGSAGVVSAGVVSAGAASGGAAGAAAGGSVLGWLAGASAGQAAAVLTAVVVGGTVVAAGVAGPNAVHRPPPASSAGVAEADGTRNEFATVPPPGGGATVKKHTAAPTSEQAKAAKAAKKRATAAATAGSTRTAPNSPNAAPNAVPNAAPNAATRAPAAKPSSAQAETPANGQSRPSTAEAAGSGQSKPTSPQAEVLGSGQNGPQDAPITGQSEPTDPQAEVLGSGQSEPRDAAAAGRAAAVDRSVDRSRVHAAGGGQG
jgi:RNA polymerase sigma factor (sigma-70 family)